MTDVQNRWFVNNDSRAVVLRRNEQYRQDIMVRVTNRSHQSTITPRIGLGSVGTTVESTVTGEAIVPLASCVMTIPKVDALNVHFTEQFVFLDFTGTLAVAENQSLESPVGLEFALIQDEDHVLLDFYEDGVTGAF